MFEAVTLIIGALVGFGARRWRLSDSVLLYSVPVLGAAATLASGEYRESWLCLPCDMAEAAIGLVMGSGLCLVLQRRTKHEHKLSEESA